MRTGGRRTLHEIDIESIIAVIIQKADARAHGFHQIPLAGHAVELAKLDAACAGATHEPECSLPVRRLLTMQATVGKQKHAQSQARGPEAIHRRRQRWPAQRDPTPGGAFPSADS